MRADISSRGRDNRARAHALIVAHAALRIPYGNSTARREKKRVNTSLHFSLVSDMDSDTIPKGGDRNSSRDLFSMADSINNFSLYFKKTFIFSLFP